MKRTAENSSGKWTYRKKTGVSCLRTSVKGHPMKDVEEANLKTLEMTLSPSQRVVYGEIATGKSLFFTGEAGTGKSYLLEIAVKRAQIQQNSKRVFVTASTGVAACRIGGTTLHSFAGVGLGEESAEILIQKLTTVKTAYARKAINRWRDALLLIIDECSMIDPAFFEKLDQIARVVRNTPQIPFGGIQVILTGDFFQLPPVQKVGAIAENVPSLSMIFETNVWRSLIGNNIFLLKEAHRQHDTKFLGLLCGLRTGSLTKQNMEVIAGRMSRVEDIPNDIVKLYPTRKEVDAVNEYKLSMLAGEPHIYDAQDKGDPYAINANKDHWMAPCKLVLKTGALVMFIKNICINSGIVNGATGIVIRFDSGNGFPVVHLQNGTAVTVSPQVWEIKQGDSIIASRMQVPLILAYAITIHKSQGMTLGRVEVDMTHIFEKGQLYVALSRCTSVEGLYIVGNIPSYSLLCPNPVVAAWWNSIISSH